MLIIEQMKSGHFSDAEQTLVDYMTENPQLLENMTTTALAQITHTNPASLFRSSEKARL